MLDTEKVPEAVESLPRGQRKVYDAAAELMLELGYPPSYREIGARAGMSSTSTISRHIEALCERGLVWQKDEKAPRTLRIAGIGYGDGRDFSAGAGKEGGTP